VPRTYQPWVEKHKPPMGFGSWCPKMPEGRAQALLDEAIADPDPQAMGGKLYAVDGDWCFVAQPTQVEREIYHGYPVPGAEVPERVLFALERVNRITRGQRNRLRRQAALPDHYE
jgi:hypothetical protein